MVCASSRRGCSVVRVPAVCFVITLSRGALALVVSVLVWGVSASAFGGSFVCLLFLSRSWALVAAAVGGLPQGHAVPGVCRGGYLVMVEVAGRSSWGSGGARGGGRGVVWFGGYRWSGRGGGHSRLRDGGVAASAESIMSTVGKGLWAVWA